VCVHALGIKATEHSLWELEVTGSGVAKVGTLGHMPHQLGAVPHQINFSKI